MLPTSRSDIAADLTARVLLHPTELHGTPTPRLTGHLGHLGGTEHQQRDQENHQDLGRAEEGMGFLSAGRDPTSA